ncbi:catecholate siderophore receptor [Altererythrobacter atlanticus]|uniref:TonB-dependent receptor BfrD n=1 Tax=Croceibacterium atlanticum TaxID=1267766 RepID=A0A0F7KSJ7_9SPHN|nr:TonB-dependent siderophore receptor [Croceibacterium atlanticum]AKH42247.1 putative TonB-dependent receptor BfrD precursor [Croceibacterium atlanticum]MBB5731023.1 catecholate siderophore receptor [Croceibacterium atlanticum]
MRNKGNARRTAGSFVALGCVGFIASAPAMAQDQSQPTRLEGVTVTDTAVNESYKAEEISSPKATAPILNTPRIVNVVTEDVLQDTASFSVEEALRTVPGITLGAGEGGVASADIPFIRGTDATGDVFVDGVRDIGSQTRESFALESIEVSKGPSSAFGGRGAAAGAINLVTKTAREGNFGTAQLTAGTSDLVRIVGDVNQQIADNVAVRVVGMYHDSEVAGRDGVFDDRWGVNPSISVGLGGPLSFSLDYYHYETDAMPDYGVPLTARGQLPDGKRRPADVDYDNFYGLLSRDFQKTNVDAVTLKAQLELAPGVVLSNTTRHSDTRNDYIVTNPDDSAGNVAAGYVWRNIKSRNSKADGVVSNTNLSAIFETGSIGHSLAAGFEFNDTDSTNFGYNVDTGNYRYSGPGTGCELDGALSSYNCTSLSNPDPADPWDGSITLRDTPSLASAREYSLYLFDTITLSDALLLNGGIRWTDFSASGSGSGRGGPYDASNSASFWSWQGGAVYKPNDAVSLYVSYANAKTPPGTTIGEGAENISANNEYYEPQTTENWEAGAKAELFGGGLLLTGAIFRIDRNNITVSDPAGEITDVLDAGRRQGFELGASGIVGPVSMMVGYTFVDSELRDGSENAGNPLPQTPKHNFAATIGWQVTPKLSIGGGAYGSSKRYADAGNLVSADGYIRVDANAQYDINDNFALRVNVNNVFDERYIVKLRNPHFAVPGAGRQALVTLTARY